jgi:hypothetical protein
MTTTYHYGDHDYWDALASPSMLELVERARSLGWKFGPKVMADGERTDVPIVALVELPPNGVLPRHRRDCDRFEVVIRGSIAVGDGVVFGPGDVETSKAGKFYGPHVAGPEGALVVDRIRGSRGSARDHGAIRHHHVERRRVDGASGYSLTLVVSRWLKLRSLPFANRRRSGPRCGRNFAPESRLARRRASPR